MEPPGPPPGLLAGEDTIIFTGEEGVTSPPPTPAPAASTTDVFWAGLLRAQLCVRDLQGAIEGHPGGGHHPPPPQGHGDVARRDTTAPGPSHQHLTMGWSSSPKVVSMEEKISPQLVSMDQKISPQLVSVEGNISPRFMSVEGKISPQFTPTDGTISPSLVPTPEPIISPHFTPLARSSSPNSLPVDQRIFHKHRGHGSTDENFFQVSTDGTISPTEKNVSAKHITRDESIFPELQSCGSTSETILQVSGNTSPTPTPTPTEKSISPEPLTISNEHRGHGSTSKSISQVSTGGNISQELPHDVPAAGSISPSFLPVAGSTSPVPRAGDQEHHGATHESISHVSVDGSISPRSTAMGGSITEYQCHVSVDGSISPRSTATGGSITEYQCHVSVDGSISPRSTATGGSISPVSVLMDELHLQEQLPTGGPSSPESTEKTHSPKSTCRDGSVPQEQVPWGGTSSPKAVAGPSSQENVPTGGTPSPKASREVTPVGWGISPESVPGDGTSPGALTRAGSTSPRVILMSGSTLRENTLMGGTTSPESSSMDSDTFLKVMPTGGTTSPQFIPMDGTTSSQFIPTAGTTLQENTPTGETTPSKSVSVDGTTSPKFIPTSGTSSQNTILGGTTLAKPIARSGNISQESRSMAGTTSLQPSSTAGTILPKFLLRDGISSQEEIPVGGTSPPKFRLMSGTTSRENTSTAGTSSPEPPEHGQEEEEEEEEEEDGGDGSSQEEEEEEPHFHTNPLFQSRLPPPVGAGGVPLYRPHCPPPPHGCPPDAVERGPPRLCDPQELPSGAGDPLRPSLTPLEFGLRKGGDRDPPSPADPPGRALPPPRALQPPQTAPDLPQGGGHRRSPPPQNLPQGGGSQPPTTPLDFPQGGGHQCLPLPQKFLQGRGPQPPQNVPNLPQGGGPQPPKPPVDVPQVRRYRPPPNSPQGEGPQPPPSPSNPLMGGGPQSPSPLSSLPPRAPPGGPRGGPGGSRRVPPPCQEVSPGEGATVQGPPPHPNTEELPPEMGTQPPADPPASTHGSAPEGSAGSQGAARGGPQPPRGDAQRLALRLFRLEGFKKSQIAAFLRKNNDFSASVAQHYLELFQFGGQSLEQALRTFLRALVLSGETQERERILGHFSRRFHRCNPGAFPSPDAVHSLTCALMLLNTDLHGQRLGRAMSSSEFVSNLSGMMDGKDFPKEQLKALYNSIRSQKLEWATDEEEDEEDEGGRLAFPPPRVELAGGPGGVTFRRGGLMRKVLAEAEGKKTPWGRRGWKPFQVVLRGTTLYFLKSGGSRRPPLEPDPFPPPPEEGGGGGPEAEEPLGIHHSLAERATKYTKRPNVFRLQTADLRLFLFQAPTPQEMFSWISRLNLVAALFSSPPFPAAVGSQRRFVRPILPAAPSTRAPEEQLCSHEAWLERVSQELLEHQGNLPGKRGRDLEEFSLKKEHLLHERRRYGTYVRVLETWLNSGARDPEGWEAEVGPTLGPPDPPTLTKAHSSPSLVTPEPPSLGPPAARVKRNISERRTVRKIVPKRSKNLL